MNSTILTSIAATGFTVAFFHAAIPTHWLPFVLVARARGWSRTRTMVATVCAGVGHVCLTSLLGVAIAWFGFQLNEQVGGLFPWIIGAFLVAVGFYYWGRQWRGKGICHHHALGGRHQPGPACGHEHDHSHWEEELQESPLMSKGVGDWTAMSGLFVMLTLSPCEGFLPIYLSGVKFGWRGFALLTAILAVGALAGMTVFTWLTLLGLDRLKVQWLERHEAGLVGGMFILLGALVVILER